MNKILEYLMQEDIKIIFDVDGVLAPFEFGKLKHNACQDKDWEGYVVKNKPYDYIKAIPQLFNFINNKGVNNVYVCSVAAPYEEENKKDFIVREYGIPEQNIRFVKNKEDKIDFLRELSKESINENKIAIVEDTVSTLNQIFEKTNFTTVHISSFFFY